MSIMAAIDECWSLLTYVRRVWSDRPLLVAVRGFVRDGEVMQMPPIGGAVVLGSVKLNDEKRLDVEVVNGGSDLEADLL